MKTEFEIKVLDVNVLELEKKILKLGGKKIKSITYKRYVYDSVPDVPGRWIRLRSDGKDTTLTFKDAKKDAIDGVDELEIKVSEFEGMKKIIDFLGVKPRLYQENRRLKYKLGKVEIAFDYWPKIPPYMEIEGPDANAVRVTLDKLETKNNPTTSATTDEIYKRYGLKLSDYPRLEL